MVVGLLVAEHQRGPSVGDVVHGACGVTNTVKKRLFIDIALWLVGVVGQRAIAREFHESCADLLYKARSIPAAERKDLLLRKGKEGAFDNSTTQLFWERLAFQQRLTLALPNALSNWYL